MHSFKQCSNICSQSKTTPSPTKTAPAAAVSSQAHNCLPQMQPSNHHKFKHKHRLSNQSLGLQPMGWHRLGSAIIRSHYLKKLDRNLLIILAPYIIIKQTFLKSTSQQNFITQFQRISQSLINCAVASKYQSNCGIPFGVSFSNSKKLTNFCQTLGLVRNRHKIIHGITENIRLEDLTRKFQEDRDKKLN